MMRPAGVALALALVACGRDKAPEATNARNAATTGSAVPVAGAAPNDCPRTGHWALCHVKKRLEQAGLAPRDTAELEGVPTLGPKPVNIMLGKAGVAIYLFADTLARHAAAATLDSTRFIPQSKPLAMNTTATLIQNDNVIVIMLGKNEHQRERVSDAITAGPPQP